MRAIKHPNSAHLTPSLTRAVDAGAWLKQGFAIMVLLSFSTASSALDFAEGKGQIHGFITQGLVTSKHNNFYGDSSDGISWDFREIGVNGSYRFNPSLMVSAQTLSRRAGEMDDGALALDYGFVDLRAINTETTTLGVRLGRMKNALGLYGETRDVATTRPGIIVPQPIYFDRSRKFALSGDGVHLYHRTHVGNGSVNTMLALVDLPINDRGSKSLLVKPHAQGRLAQDRLSKGFRLLYETDDAHWTTAFSYLSLSQRYHPTAGDINPPSSSLIEPWILSLQYTNEQWTFTGEYSQRNTEFSRNQRLISDNIAENWYLQSQYRFAPKWELLLRYDASAMDKHDTKGKHFAAANPGAIAFTRYAQDWVAGVRYDVTPSFMLRAELHSIEGTGWTSPLENPISSDLNKHWNMFMLMGSYYF